MDKQQAREILRLYRPGAPDTPDVLVVEALQMARRDAELAQWFEQHCRSYLAIQAKLKALPVPADLQRKILEAERTRRGKIVDLRKFFLPLAAAAAVAFLAGGAWWLSARGENFSLYRERLVKQSQRGYEMSMVSTNLASIHDYLLAKQCPDYVLTPSLAKLPGEGCTTLEVRGRKVSMVCLNGGKGRDLFLFVMDRSKLTGIPSGEERSFAKIRQLETASWTHGDKIYILAGPLDESQLKQYLD